MKRRPLLFAAALLFSACHHSPSGSAPFPATAPVVSVADLSEEIGDKRKTGPLDIPYAIQRPTPGAATLEDLVFVGVDVEMKHLTIRNYAGGVERKFLLLITESKRTPDGLQISANGEGRYVTLGFTGAALVYSAMNKVTHALSVRPAQKLSEDEAHRLILGDSI